MNKNFAAGVAAAAMLVSSPVVAQDKYAVHPVRLGAETIRFYKGTPTIDVDGKDGAVQVSPLPMDHGSFSFSVAVLNKGQAPADFDISAVSLDADGLAIATLSKDELEKKAKNRAMWAAIAVGVAGGLSAAAAASQRDYYSSTLYTPRGTYRATYSAPSVAGQIQASAIAAGTGYSIAKIQENLDATREALGNNIVQRTTVDPDESYAGQVVLKKFKLKTLPQRVAVLVRWNGEDYRFGFLVGKRGMKAPEIAPAPVTVVPVVTSEAAVVTAPLAQP